MAIISCASITAWVRDKNRVSYTMHSVNEKYELINLMFKYHELYGVDSYEEDDDGIEWGINGHWYTTEELDRMAKLKVFL